MAFAMNLTVANFKVYSTHALKKCLAIKKKQQRVGNNQDLAARVFACYENVPVGISMEEKYRW